AASGDGSFLLLTAGSTAEFDTRSSVNRTPCTVTGKRSSQFEIAIWFKKNLVRYRVAASRFTDPNHASRSRTYSATHAFSPERGHSCPHECEARTPPTRKASLPVSSRAKRTRARIRSHPP